MSAADRAAFRALAAELDGVDREVYETFGVDPLEPILGEGDPLCRVAFFGRDPGREEVRHGVPFVGAGGQKIRRVLSDRLTGDPAPDLEASIAAGRKAFWANTVPYKPVGNKAWSQAVKARFRPLMVDVLVRGWRGRDVVVLGQDAFLWFASGRDEKRRLTDFWAREDRFEASIEVVLTARDGADATLRIHPLPHPSPLNATWASRFPGLLEARLDAVGWGPETWRLTGQEARGV